MGTDSHDDLPLHLGLDRLAGLLDPTALHGVELRYVLTDLMDRPPYRTWRVAELVDVVTSAGFRIGDPPSKVVSGTLRAEVEHGRVVRVGWGRYRSSGGIPGATRRRIRARAADRWARVGPAVAATSRADVVGG